MATLFDTGIFSVIDVDSALLSGAKLYWYVATTPVDTYTTSALDIENANPVVADANGRFPAIWLEPGTYKYILTEAGGSPASPILTRDGYIAEPNAPEIDAALEDFLAGDDPLPIANGGTGATTNVDALAQLGGMGAVGGAFSGQITQATKGAYLYNAVAGMANGAVFVTADNIADPRTEDGQWWFTYPA